MFALRDELHLFGNETLPRKMHLRHVPVSVCGCCRRFSFFDPGIAQSHVHSPVRVTQPGRRAKKRFRIVKLDYGTALLPQQPGRALSEKRPRNPGELKASA
jgi:hypothetical protein